VIDERTIAGPAGRLSLRVFTPRDVQGIYLHLHGGGWVFGSSRGQDAQLAELAGACRAAVVSVEYRLAPAHPYPAALDDCEAAALWLTKHSVAEFGSDRIGIGGESVGAQLSVLTLIRLRDRHGFTGFRAANLTFGVFDLGLTPSARTWATEPSLDWCIDQFVPRDQRRSPAVSPLYADVRALPDALFTVGALDPLVDDTMLMCRRWRAAGNGAELAVYPGGDHSFTSAPTALAQRANRRIHEFLNERLLPGHFLRYG
jgi:acetyl esterase